MGVGAKDAAARLEGTCRRKPREEVEDGIHHVFARGNDRQLIFWDDEDRLRYLKGLCDVVWRKRWRCLAYCLMDNHVHLLVQTPEANLGDGMQRLHGELRADVQRAARKVGHVFQGRYGSKLMRSDEQLWTTARYIPRNPVEAGLCRSGGGVAVEQPPRRCRGNGPSVARSCRGCSAISARWEGIRRPSTPT